MEWLSFPVLVEFHRQWWGNRSGRVGEGRVPFSRDWERLLQDAGLNSADLRREAERDVRVLHEAGLLRIKPPARRRHLIDRIQLPVDQELRLAALFGDPLEDPDGAFDPASADWVPELAFLADLKSLSAPGDLLAINRFLQDGGRARPPVPVKERSVEIFGDEKRLDALAATSLFQRGPLSLELVRAFVVPEPLGWRMGPGPEGRLLAVENAATWDSFSRWNRQAAVWSAVIYGAGHRFIDGIMFLPEIAQGPIARIDYFGDIDPEGLRIPQLAGARGAGLGLPQPLPLAPAYRHLLDNGRPATLSPGPLDPEICLWLGDALAPRALSLFRAGQRIAQEHLGWEALSDGCFSRKDLSELPARQP